MAADLQRVNLETINMRLNQDFSPLFQAPMADRCPRCHSSSCRNSPKAMEKERSQVLSITRQKCSSFSDDGHSLCDMALGSCSSIDQCEDLRKQVAVKNTLKKLEREIHNEILRAFMN